MRRERHDGHCGCGLPMVERATAICPRYEGEPFPLREMALFHFWFVSFFFVFGLPVRLEKR